MEPRIEAKTTALTEQELRAQKVRKQVKWSVLAFVAAIAVHLFNFHFPMQSELSRVRRSNEALEKQIGTISGQLRELNAASALKDKELVQQSLYKRILATVPNSPMVYCPLQVTGIMKKAKILKPRFTLQMLLPFPNSDGLMKQSWKVEVPTADPLALGSAIADLETTFPLAQLTSLGITKRPGASGVSAELIVQFAVQP